MINLLLQVLALHVAPVLTEEQQSILNKARCLINEALENDEKGDQKKALTLYIEAVEVCTSAVSTTLIKYLP